MIALFAAALLTAQFKGGTPNEFVQFLAENTRQNVVFAPGEAKPIRPATLQITDKERWAKEIQDQTSLSLLSNEGLVLSDLSLPRNRVTATTIRDIYSKSETAEKSEKRFNDYIFSLEPVKPLTVRFPALKATATRSGRVTYKTKNSNALNVAGLSQLLSKPVKSHWIYREVPLFVHVQGMPERDFLRMVAKGLGAKLVDHPQSYALELDPIEIRRRAITTMMRHVHHCDKHSVSDRSCNAYKENERRTFRIACLNLLTPAQIAKIVSTPNEKLTIEAPSKSVLSNLILGCYKRMAEEEATWHESAARSRTGTIALERADPSRGMFIIVDAKFSVKFGWV